MLIVAVIMTTAQIYRAKGQYAQNEQKRQICSARPLVATTAWTDLNVSD